MSSRAKTHLSDLLRQLEKDFPAIDFLEADAFSWSAGENAVFFTQKVENGVWSLLHEMGHMLRKHSTYESDIALIRMEIEAWESAKELAQRYGHSIDKEHIEQCIDSYRDWLHERSKCTVCEQAGLEQISGHYQCLNCGHRWKVGHDRFCRVYRKKIEPRLNEALPAG